MSLAKQVAFWIWTRFFGRASPAQPDTTAEQVRSNVENWKSNARALLANEANWRLVLESLGRLEGAGLRIDPALDRDLIAVRFLIIGRPAPP